MSTKLNGKTAPTKKEASKEASTLKETSKKATPTKGGPAKQNLAPNSTKVSVTKQTSPKAAEKGAKKKAPKSTESEGDLAEFKMKSDISDEDSADDKDLALHEVPDEIEDEEEASANSQSGNAAALAAATGTATEMSASFKNFRHHPDMENFYRFIFENDLRHEALAIIEEIIADKKQNRTTKGLKG